MVRQRINAFILNFKLIMILKPPLDETFMVLCLAFGRQIDDGQPKIFSKPHHPDKLGQV
jgi:hypothetical protein